MLFRKGVAGPGNNGSRIENAGEGGRPVRGYSETAKRLEYQSTVFRQQAPPEGIKSPRQGGEKR